MLNEIGTLRALPNGESVFVGSSSGVFFINTVRRAFSKAATQSASASRHVAGINTNQTLGALPSPEECIISADAHPKRNALSSLGNVLEQLPPQDVARELLMTYFQIWHPLLPFLHGPTCLQDFEILYADVDARTTSSKSLASLISFQCIFRIARLDHPEQLAMAQLSDDDLMGALSTMLLRSDLITIQTLLVVQLYFVATMSLRAASTVSGLVMRSIFKAGLHRCPFRYATFTADDRDMRKRVFWSAYTLDRYVSQSLGHPLGIQDSDIDVCEPGRHELHRPVVPLHDVNEGTPPEETVLHLPANHPQRHHVSLDQPHAASASSSRRGSVQDEEEERCSETAWPPVDTDSAPSSHKRQENQIAQSQFVRYSQLVGRMLELFHKSIHARSIGRQNVLLLKTDIDAWGNDLQYQTTSKAHDQTVSGLANRALDQEAFFDVARQQMVLLVNRPTLSLEPTSAEFRHAIQICIGAARSIIRRLEKQVNAQAPLFWPGFMSAVWMGGLVMAYACQSKLHKPSHAISDISAALRVLHAMSHRWAMAKNCHDVLEMLLDSIQHKETEHQASPKSSSDRTQSVGLSSQRISLNGSAKRPREDVRPMHETNDTQRGKMPRTNQHVALDHTGEGTQTGDSASVHRFQNLDSTFGNYAHLLHSNGIPMTAPFIVPPTLPGPPLAAPQQYQNLQANANTLTGDHSKQYDTPGGLNGNSLPFSLDGWSAESDMVSTFDSTTLHDIFDGAAWGSLLDMMEPIT